MYAFYVHDIGAEFLEEQPPPVDAVWSQSKGILDSIFVVCIDLLLSPKHAFELF